MKRSVLFCFFLFQFTSSIIGRQLVSGHLELVTTNFTTSEYELRVKVFNTIPTSIAQNLYIFSNSTKKIAQIIYKVPFVNSRSSESPLELPYYNYHCAVSATINSDSDLEGIPPASQYETTYATKLQLDPQVFNDPLGYTFVIEGMQGDFGNYDLELSNIEKYIPVLTSVGPFNLTNTLLLVLTTPALSIKNSSPVFAPYNPMIYCSGRKPVTLLVACQDPDQDELRYSLVKPYSVFSEHSPNITLDNLYPVVYKSPFTATNPLKGSISIDSKTGIMTISATGSGAYVVCVKVDQIRDGKVIGYTHKFYILYLSNCTNGEDPIPNLKADGFPQGISSISFCEGQSTKLIIDSNPNWIIDWTLNGYPIPDTKNKSTIDAKKEGVYEVKVKYNVPLFNGVVLLGCTNINVDNVIVDFKKAPKTDISGQKQICVGGESFLKLNTSENLTYQWYKDGVKISGAVTANLTTKDKGKYWVQFTVVGAQNNCSYNSDSIDVDIKDSPQKLSIQVQSDNKQLCNQQSEVLLSVDNLSSLQLQWYRNGLLINNETNNTLKVTQSGTYTIKIDDATTKCNSNSDPYEVILLPRKDVILETSDKKLTYCTGDKISASVSNWSDVTYTWYFNNDKLVEGQSLNTIDISQQGIYKVDILDSYNCKASSQSLSISILDKIPIEFSPIESMCVSDPSVVLQATPSNGIFSGVGIDGKKFNPRISGAGIFNISYEIANMNACQNGKISRTVEVFPLPTPESLAKALYLRKGQTVVLNTGNKINYSYEWTPRDYLSNAFIGNPNCTPTQNIEYKYKIKNEYGCLYQGSVKVFIEENVLIPNIFTPNNDGYNDTWELFGMDSYTDVEVMIYNRWGNLVFFSKGYNNPFDGKDLNGIDCPNDSYAYVIKFVKNNGLPYELKGGLTIAR